MSSHADALARDDLDELSDLNMLNFYRDELREIDLGAKASDYLNTNTRKRFVEIGFLEPATLRIRDRGVRRWKLTVKARRLLDRA